MRKPVVFVAAAFVTAATLSLALALGSWAFSHRRMTLHYGRLQRLTAEHPSGVRVEAALILDGARLVARASTRDELQAVAARWAPGSEGAVVESGGRFKTTRIAVVGGMVYFLFFDDQDTLRDFAVKPAPPGE